jgi:menaquinone-specific isochorismate synthase
LQVLRASGGRSIDGYAVPVTWPDTAPPRLYARTVEIDDPGRLLDWLPDADAFAWVRDGDGMVGWGEVVTHKPSTVLDADQWWSDMVSQVVAVSELAEAPAGSGFMAFGSFVFDPDNTHARSVLTVPETIVGRRRGRSWMTRIGAEFRHDDVRPQLGSVRAPVQVSYADGGLTGPQWESAVAEAVTRIGTGEVDKVVLARDLLARAESDIDARWLVGRLAAEYSRCWTYAVDGLVGATPEMLVRQENGLATSRVLAGTIRRSGDSPRDLASAAALARSSKDLEEHEYAVASVAEALAPFCSGMHVPESPYVLELPNVLHLATDVAAVTERGTSALRLAAALHPSAAVCGTPTAPARAMIAELEKMDRERYAGPVGWIDAHGDGEWGIALRCGQLDETDPRQIRLFAGCGIVAGSDPEAELAEAAAKLIPMRDALGG